MSGRYWFRPKKYGWGFVPISPEGWLATLVLLIFILISLQTNGFLVGVPSSEETLRFLFDLFVISTIFTMVLKSKIKGKLTGNRGKPKKRKRR